MLSLRCEIMPPPFLHDHANVNDANLSGFQHFSISQSSQCGKIRTRITPNTDTFYAVCSTYLRLLLCMETTKNIINSSMASPGFLTMQWEIGAPSSLIKTT